MKISVQVTPQARMRPDLLAVVNGSVYQQCRKGPDGFFIGPANFIADIFPQDSWLDYAQRCDTYQHAGVVEYVAWRVSSPQPVWNRLTDGRYVEVPTDDHGVIKSAALPGLWVPLPAFRERDWHQILAAIAEGVSSREHHEFMATIWA